MLVDIISAIIVDIGLATIMAACAISVAEHVQKGE